MNHLRGSRSRGSRKVVQNYLLSGSQLRLAVTVCAFEIPKFDHFWANMARMSTRWSTNAACEEEAMEVSPLANSMCTPYYCTFPRATTRCTFSQRKIVHETARLVSSATRLSVSFLPFFSNSFSWIPKSSKNRTRGRMLRPQEQDSRENAPPSRTGLAGECSALQKQDSRENAPV